MGTSLLHFLCSRKLTADQTDFSDISFQQGILFFNGLTHSYNLLESRKIMHQFMDECFKRLNIANKTLQIPGSILY